MEKSSVLYMYCFSPHYLSVIIKANKEALAVLLHCDKMLWTFKNTKEM